MQYSEISLILRQQAKAESQNKFTTAYNQRKSGATKT